MYGKDWEYARSRLIGTVVRYNDVPVMVADVDSSCMAHVQDLEDGEIGKVSLEDLDLKPVPLGYCNFEKAHAVYLQRVPMRRDWRQGLRKENMRGDNLARISWKLIKKTILGKYPTFEECLETKRKTAWARYWATDSVNVYYKDYSEIVGKIKDKKVVLLPDFQYLESCLGDSNAHCI